MILYIVLNIIGLTRTTVDHYLNAHGLYNDIWAPLAEAGLNIGFSILLGYFWGLNGIIMGILISQVAIISLWKPYFLLRKVCIFRHINIFACNLQIYCVSFSVCFVLSYFQTLVIGADF